MKAIEIISKDFILALWIKKDENGAELRTATIHTRVDVAVVGKGVDIAARNYSVGWTLDPGPDAQEAGCTLAACMVLGRDGKYQNLPCAARIAVPDGEDPLEYDRDTDPYDVIRKFYIANCGVGDVNVRDVAALTEADRLALNVPDNNE